MPSSLPRTLYAYDITDLDHDATDTHVLSSAVTLSHDRARVAFMRITVTDGTKDYEVAIYDATDRATLYAKTAIGVDYPMSKAVKLDHAHTIQVLVTNRSGAHASYRVEYIVSQ